MKKVAKFSKVSFEQFVEDCKGILGDVYIENKMEYLSEKYKKNTNHIRAMISVINGIQVVYILCTKI